MTGIEGFDLNLREIAYDYEQKLLDEYKGNPLLLNVATDARVFNKGATPSPETIEKRAESLRRLWDNPVFREAATARIKAIRSSIEQRNKQAEITKELWSDPEHRAKVAATKATPESIAKASASHLAQWEKPGYKDKMTADRNTPEYIAQARIAKKAKMKAVSINGIVYESIMDASRQLQMRKQTIKDRLKRNAEGYQYVS